MVVDTINDTQEIVVKPLGKQLRTLNCFAGATIMGDGKIALILDVQGIAQQTHIFAEKQKALLAEETVAKQPEEAPQQLLVVQVPMDIIFMRNVLIYFELETKRAILSKVRRVLKPDGYLFLGGGETTINLDDAFEPIQFGKAVYYKLRCVTDNS